jgi:hypothetical protein
VVLVHQEHLGLVLRVDQALIFLDLLAVVAVVVVTMVVLVVALVVMEDYMAVAQLERA